VYSAVATAPILGGDMTLVVTGITGTMSSTRPDKGIFSFSPASLADWPADCFELKDTKIELLGGNTGTYDDGLVVDNLDKPATDYTITYTFNVACMTQSDTKVSPINFISSGNMNLKHTDVDTTAYLAIPPVQPPVNLLTMSLEVTPSSFVNGGIATYTIHFYSDADISTEIDELYVTLATSPNILTYISGTSNFEGSEIGDPFVSGSVLKWAHDFTIPAKGSSSVSFQVRVPSTA